MTDEIKTLEDFEKAVVSHDLTFDYSDDHQCWKRGCASKDRIRRAATKFDRADVERIWNAAVDKKMLPDFSSQFYWRD